MFLVSKQPREVRGSPGEDVVGGEQGKDTGTISLRKFWSSFFILPVTSSSWRFGSRRRRRKRKHRLDE